MGKKIGRNDPCPCGSGKKYKLCCINKMSEEEIQALYLEQFELTKGLNEANKCHKILDIGKRIIEHQQNSICATLTTDLCIRGIPDMRRELIESYYEEYQRELERFLESDQEMFSLEAEIHHYIEILEPVLRDDGQKMWQALDRIISAKNAMEGIAAKEMYIRGFLDYERLVCEKDNHI